MTTAVDHSKEQSEPYKIVKNKTHELLISEKHIELKKRDGSSLHLLSWGFFLDELVYLKDIESHARSMKHIIDIH